MAIRGVKITGLNYLGNSINNDIIFPVVDANISPSLPEGETLQTTLKEIGNFILSEAGNSLIYANVANTVRNNAQPNITSVGTLVGLTSTGTINFTSTGNVSLGSIANLHIDGGSNGYVLHTYGNGSLYWDEDYAYPGGPNQAVQFKNGNIFDGSSSFTFDNTSNTLTVTNLVAGNITGNLGNLIANHIDANTIDVDTITIGNIEIQGVGQGTSQQVLGIVDQNTQQLGWKTVPVYYITIELRDGNTYLSSPNAVLRVYPVQQRDGSFLDLNTTQI
jgi:hypothetical protein